MQHIAIQHRVLLCRTGSAQCINSATSSSCFDDREGHQGAATQGVNSTPESNFQQTHYLRTITPLAPEALAAFPTGRLNSNRSNPYTAAGGYGRLGSGLESFHSCSGGLNAKLDPNTPNDPNFNAITGGDVTAAQTLFDNIKKYAFGGETESSAVPAPPCIPQGGFSSLGQIPEVTDYWHVYSRNP